MADSNSPYRIIAAADASTLEKLVNDLVKQNPGFKVVGMVAASGPNAGLVVALENERRPTR